MKKLTAVTGFITNSSSVVYHFPMSALENPKIKLFMERNGLIDSDGSCHGFIGDDLWNRAYCSSIVFTADEKQGAITNLRGDDAEYYCPPVIDMQSDDFVIIYGDEYESLAADFAHLLHDENIGSSRYQDYN